MTSADLLTLLDYHYWARDRVLDAVSELPPDLRTREMGGSFRNIHETLVHIYSGEVTWYQRWIGQSPTAHVDPATIADVATLRERWTALGTQVRGYVQAAGDAGVNRVHVYRTFAGAPGQSTLGEMTQHLVNHASYHRGQVTMLLRQLGAPPPRAMDLIHFLRERRP
jgi:uncharacterized damage-inducible protein DinB